jgi:CheY-like chemotaxis protein
LTVRLDIPETPVKVRAIATADLLRGVRVLVVDDNRTNRRIFEGMLKRWEMRVTQEPGGEKTHARRLGKGEPYALILTDMHMPNYAPRRKEVLSRQ